MKKYMVFAMMLALFLTPIASASVVTPIIKAASPDTPLEVNEGDLVTFNADVETQMPLPVHVEWFMDDVLVYEETIPEGMVIWWYWVAEAGNHQLKLLLTGFDDTIATHDWDITVAAKTHTITGKVTYDDGSSADGVAVLLYSGSGKNKLLVGETTTDLSGNYEFSVSEPETYEVLVIAPEGYRASPRKGVVEITGDMQAEPIIDFVLNVMKGKKPKG